MFEVV